MSEPTPGTWKAYARDDGSWQLEDLGKGLMKEPLPRLLCRSPPPKRTRWGQMRPIREMVRPPASCARQTVYASEEARKADLLPIGKGLVG
jgi:hypothetical protein